MPTLKLAIDAREARKGAIEFGESVESVAKSARTGTNAAKGFSQEIDRTGRAAAKTRAAIAGTSEATERSNRRAQQGTRRWRGFNRELARTNKTASRFVGTMTRLGAGIAGVAAARGAISVMASFEQTIALVGGVTRATSGEFEALSASAREMGATTRFSAREAADGLLFLSRAGFSATEAIQAIPDVLNLAQAGAIGLGEAADFASNILRQFNLEANETNRIVDTLIAVSNRSNTNVQQLAEALKFAGPVAGALGMEVEETASAIGILGDAGIQASLAGTNLRGSFAALLAPTEAALKVLNNMGLTLADISPATNTITTIFRRFRDAGLDAAGAVELFGRRNAAAALVLTGSVDKLEDMTNSAILAGGEAEELARKMDDTLVGSFKNFISVLQEIVLGLGESGLGQAVRGTIDFFTDLLRVIGGVTKEGEEASTMTKILARGFQFLVVAGSAYLALNIAEGIVQVAIAARKATTAVTGLNAAMLTNPWGIALAAISGLTALLVTMSDEVDRGNEKILELANSFDELARRQATIGRAAALFEQESAEGTPQDQLKSIELFIDKIGEFRKDYEVSVREFKRAVGNEPLSNNLISSGQTGAEIGEADFRKIFGFDFAELRSRLEAEREEIERETKEIRDLLGSISAENPAIPFDDAARIPFAGFEEATERAKQRLKELSQASNEFFENAFTTNADGESVINLPLLLSELDRLEAELEDRRATIVLDVETDPNAKMDAEREARKLAEAAQATWEQVYVGQQNITDNLTRSEAELQKILDREEAISILTKAGLEIQEEKVQLLIKELELRRKIEESVDPGPKPKPKPKDPSGPKPVSSSDALVQDLRFRSTLIGMTEEQQEKELFLYDARSQAISDGRQDIEGYMKTVERLYDVLADDRRSKEIQQQWEAVAASIGQTFGDTLFDIVTDFENAMDSLESMLRRLSEIVFQELVTNQLIDILGNINFGGGGGGPTPTPTPAPTTTTPTSASSLQFARGGIVSPGGVHMFAKGGVVDRPTPFRAGLQHGMMGEAGKEVIMRAAKLSDGTLGVRGVVPEGSGQAPNVTMNVYTQDAGSFNRSQRQTLEKMRRLIS